MSVCAEEGRKEQTLHGLLSRIFLSVCGQAAEGRPPGCLCSHTVVSKENNHSCVDTAGGSCGPGCCSGTPPFWHFGSCTISVLSIWRSAGAFGPLVHFAVLVDQLGQCYPIISVWLLTRDTPRDDVTYSGRSHPLSDAILTLHPWPVTHLIGPFQRHHFYHES